MTQLTEVRSRRKTKKAEPVWQTRAFSQTRFSSSVIGGGVVTSPEFRVIHSFMMGSTPQQAVPAEFRLSPVPPLTEINATINGYLQLGHNWDGEDALPLSSKVAAQAKKLIRQIAGEASVRGLAWLDPAMAPHPEGGLEISWSKGNRWAMLMLQPGSARIGCATQDADSAPGYQVESRGDAIERVLWVLRAE